MTTITSAAKSHNHRNWITFVPGGTAHLRVDAAGRIEYLHSHTGEWVLYDDISGEVSRSVDHEIRETARQLAGEARLDDIRREIDDLAAREIAIETNAGTYGDVEAFRAIGVGDPQFADYTIYERVGDGRRRVKGCDPADAPGWRRRINRGELQAARRRLQELREMLG